MTTLTVLKILLMMMGAFILIKASNIVVKGLNRLSKTAHWRKFGIAAVILALSTSLPELSVGIITAINKTPALSLGNVVGSNVANISLVMGGAALMSGSVAVIGSYLKRDFILAFLAGSLPLLLLMDGKLGRVDGVILLSAYGYYLFSVVHKKHVKAMRTDKEGLMGRFLRKFEVLGKSSVRKSMVQVMLGLGLLLFSGQVIVRLGIQVAEDLHMPVLLVGLFIVAVGTSLPELVLATKAIAEKEVALVFGNLLGSTVANSTLIIGLVAVLSPIEIVAVRSYFLATIAYIILFWLFWLFTKTKKRLDRWEGALLLVGYLLFLGLELIKENGWGLGLPNWFQWILGR